MQQIRANFSGELIEYAVVSEEEPQNDAETQVKSDASQP
jgi:hypothetical protein